MGRNCRIGGLIAAVVPVLLCAGRPAAASESRADALLYNLAMPDAVDVFLFPHLAPQHRQVTFFLPAAARQMYGGAILGTPEWAIGVFAHRRAFDAFDQYRLKVYGLPAAEPVPTLAGQVLDVMFGNGRFGIGLRIHGWSDGSEQNPTVSPVIDPNAVLTDAPVPASYLGGDLVISARPVDGLDTRLNFGFSWMDEQFQMYRIRLGGRWIQPNPSGMVRFVAAFQPEFLVGVPDDDDLDKAYAIGIPLKLGVQLDLVPNRLTAGVLGGIDFQYYDPGQAASRAGFAVPTFELAVEFKAIEWLFLRTSIKSGYGVLIDGPEDSDGDMPHPKYEQLDFNSGIGFVIGPCTLDATIRYSVWQNGPYFVGGEKGLFGSATASYVF